MLPNTPCEFPECTTPAAHLHHIVYDDPEATANLCRKHHEDITIINGAKARAAKSGYNWRYRHYQKLTDYQRWTIWEGWLRGELKPKRTKKALEWLADWDRFDREPAQV